MPSRPDPSSGSAKLAVTTTSSTNSPTDDTTSRVRSSSRRSFPAITAAEPSQVTTPPPCGGGAGTRRRSRGRIRASLRPSTTRPRDSTTTRSGPLIARATSCRVTSRTRSGVWRRPSSSDSESAATSSRPVYGSSSNSTRGRCTSARASATRCVVPRESVRTVRSRTLSTSIRAAASHHRPPGIGHAEQSRMEAEVLSGGQVGIEHRLVADHADLRAEARAGAPHVDARDRDASGGRSCQPRDHVEQGRSSPRRSRPSRR